MTFPRQAEAAQLNSVIKEYIDALTTVLEPLHIALVQVMRDVYVWMKRTNAILWLAQRGISHPVVNWMINRLPGWLLPEPLHLLELFDINGGSNETSGVGKEGKEGSRG